MASAFTEKEKDAIRQKLKEEAGRLASTIGMRKTTVDQLAEAAEISKGAFYKLFYETKELLFFEVFEDWHAEIYGKAEAIFHEHKRLPPEECLYRVFMEIIRLVKEHSILRFVQNDLPFLLRKLPPEILAEHYHSDDDHIRALMEHSGFCVAATPAQISIMVHILLQGALYWDNGSDDFKAAQSMLVRGACRMAVRGWED